MSERQKVLPRPLAPFRIAVGNRLKELECRIEVLETKHELELLEIAADAQTQTNPIDEQATNIGDVMDSAEVEVDRVGEYIYELHVNFYNVLAAGALDLSQSTANFVVEQGHTLYYNRLHSSLLFKTVPLLAAPVNLVFDTMTDTVNFVFVTTIRVTSPGRIRPRLTSGVGSFSATGMSRLRRLRR